MSEVIGSLNGKFVERSPGEFRGYSFHLIGIGGSGMCGAATILLRSGAMVTGSDRVGFVGMGELVQAGARVYLCHEAQHVTDDVDVVVRSAAVPDDNPEVVAAREKSIPVIYYAELLGEITRSRLGVSISGTHGKSTTTGMVAHLFQKGGLNPSFILGAECEQLGGSSGVGTGEHFVVESCEYGRSFLHMKPHSAAILNIEADHLDFYRDIDEICDAFCAFAAGVSSNGLVVVNHDDALARRAGRRAACRVETFGFGPGADWRATSVRSGRGGTVFRIMRRGETAAECRLRLAGDHNVSNALAAVALAREAGIPLEIISAGLSSFGGIHRRMSLRGQGRGVTIVDDFAHHPTEIRKTLQAIRGRYSPRRTWVVFQPHQASRTRQLMDDFSRAFDDADVVLVPDIYSVRDSVEDCQSVASSGLVDRIRALGKESRYVSSFEEACEHVVNGAGAGDVIVTMGAGDVWKVADRLVDSVCPNE